ncbi:movement protein [Rice latent virus 2]|uniref:Movement protein n=1 Tax=Rice latent virus 2 TaxID=2012857 RepID=A0A2D0WZE5_9GEMI|nr:movement protein [Rice latent virus 2]ASA49172.1 movement protein [Rice latent virus 2]
MWMESGHLPQVGYQVQPSPPAVTSTFVGNDGAWRFLVLLTACSCLAGAAVFACWRMCGKDLLLTLKAKRSRTITELGFGQTPEQRRAGTSSQPVGVIG